MRSFLKLFTILIAATFILASPGAIAIDEDAWTLDDVLQKVVEVNGGLDSVESTTNLRVIGKVLRGEFAYEFLLLKKRPDMVRIHLMHKGRSIETGFNGEVAWRRVWVNGRDTVQQLSEAELAAANLEIDFDGPLIGPTLPGTKRTFLGVERINRIDYFVVGVDDGLSRSRHYIDSRTFREWRTIRDILNGEEVVGTVQTTYSQYVRHGTIWLAEKVERILTDGSTDVIVVEKAEVDPGILDRVFDVPKQWSES